MNRKIDKIYKNYKPKRIPGMCKCEKCTKNANKNINKKIKSYFAICKCGCIQGYHLTIQNPNFSAGQCMQCDNCSGFIQDVV